MNLRLIIILAAVLLNACGGGGGGGNSNNPPDSTPCTNTSWTPLTSAIQEGVRFTQTSNCGNTRTAIGTKIPQQTQQTPQQPQRPQQPQTPRVAMVAFSASQSLNFTLLKTQITPTFDAFSVVASPSLGVLTLGGTTLTYLSHKYNVTDTFSIDTIGDGNANIVVSIMINRGDPLFVNQWYIVNQRRDILGDINAEQSLAKGYSGKGVHVAVFDNGINTDHEDLDVFESYDDSNFRREHGTGVAGIIAASGYNGKGIRGIAYNVKLHNYLSKNSISHWIKTTGSSTINPSSKQVDIFNFSTSANSEVRDRHRILGYGTANHRGGKGAIYVPGAGNERDRRTVQLSEPQWANYTIPVGAINPLTNQRAGYSSAGVGLWLTTYSQPQSESRTGNNGLLTTDIGNQDYHYFGGTSGAAPVVSAAIALMLEANASLTWRDVKHILATTVAPIHTDIAPATQLIGGIEYETRQAWTTNATGYDFHEWYGFGKLDVDAAVSMAENYIPNAYSVLNNSNYVDLSPDDVQFNPLAGHWHASDTMISIAIPANNGIGVSRTIIVSEDISIESMDIFWNLANTGGRTAIKLVAPSGSSAIIAPVSSGSRDKSQVGVNSFYGESSKGNWTIRLVSHDAFRGEGGTLNDWGVRFYGVAN